MTSLSNVSFTVTCSNVEQKALLYAMTDIQVWLQQTLTSRAGVAMRDLVQSETQRMLNDPTVQSIPATREAIIMNCPLPILSNVAPPSVLVPPPNTMVSSNVASPA